MCVHNDMCMGILHVAISSLTTACANRRCSMVSVSFYAGCTVNSNCLQTYPYLTPHTPTHNLSTPGIHIAQLKQLHTHPPRIHTIAHSPPPTSVCFLSIYVTFLIHLLIHLPVNGSKKGAPNDHSHPYVYVSSKILRHQVNLSCQSVCVCIVRYIHHV